VVQAPVFCGTYVEHSGHTGKGMFLIFKVLLQTDA